MISFEPLFRTMQEKGFTTYRLLKCGFPMTNYYAIKNGKNITIGTINALCEILDCQVSDIMEYRKTDCENE